MRKTAPQNCFLSKNLKIAQVKNHYWCMKNGRNRLSRGDQHEIAYISWRPWDKLVDRETSPSKPPQSAPKQQHNRLHAQCLLEWYTLGTTHFCGIDEASLKAACSSGWNSLVGSRVTFNRDQREPRFEDEKLPTHWRELRTILASSPWKLRSALQERLLEKTRSKIVCSRAAASFAGSIWDPSASRSSITFRIADKTRLTIAASSTPSVAGDEVVELRASKLISSFPALWGHSLGDFRLVRCEGIEMARAWAWINLSTAARGEVSRATCSPGVNSRLDVAGTVSSTAWGGL